MKQENNVLKTSAAEPITKGIVLVVGGLLFLFHNLNILNEVLDEFFINWQMIIIGIGIIHLAEPAERTGGLVTIVVGVCLFVPDYYNLGIESYKLILPIGLICIGILTMLRNQINGKVIRNQNVIQP